MKALVSVLCVACCLSLPLSSAPLGCFRAGFAHPKRYVAWRGGVGSPEECQEVCYDSNSKCLYFVYENSSGSCWLKTELEEVESVHVNSSVVMGPAKCLRKDGDGPRHDITDISGGSILNDTNDDDNDDDDDNNTDDDSSSSNSNTSGIKLANTSVLPDFDFFTSFFNPNPSSMTQWMNDFFYNWGLSLSQPFTLFGVRPAHGGQGGALLFRPVANLGEMKSSEEESSEKSSEESSGGAEEHQRGKGHVRVHEEEEQHNVGGAVVVSDWSEGSTIGSSLVGRQTLFDWSGLRCRQICSEDGRQCQTQCN